MNNIYKLALKDLNVNKMRNLLTIIAILLSVFLIYSISTISSSFHEKMFNEMKISDQDVLTIAFGNKENTLNYEYLPLFTEKDIDAMKSIDGIKNIAGIKGINASSIQTPNGKQIIYTTIKGVNKEFLSNLNISLAEGRLPEYDNEVIIGSSIKESSNLKLNDVLKIQVNDKIIEAKVVGVIEKQKVQAFSTLPSEINQMIAVNSDNIYLKDTKYMCISAKIKDISKIDEVSQVIVKKLQENKEIKNSLDGTGLDVIVVSKKDVLDMIGRWFTYINLFIIVLAILICIISIVNIVNIMTISIKEKYKSIAVFKIVGATEKQVERIFLTESFILGIISSIIGVSLGIVFSMIVIKILYWPRIFNIKILMLSILLGILASTISGFIVSKGAGKSQISVLLNE